MKIFLSKMNNAIKLYLCLMCSELIKSSMSFVFFFLVCLRIQINPQNKGEFLSISPERAFADFLFAHTVLHLVVMNFIGWNRRASGSSCPPLRRCLFHTFVSLLKILFDNDIFAYNPSDTVKIFKLYGFNTPNI